MTDASQPGLMSFGKARHPDSIGPTVQIVIVNPGYKPRASGSPDGRHHRRRLAADHCTDRLPAGYSRWLKIGRLILPLSTVLFQGCYVGYEHKDQKWSYASWNEGFGETDQLIPDADSRSFHTIHGTQYAADSHHVYYEGNIVPGADPESFEQIRSYWWKDHSTVYFVDRPIEGADPRTFVVLKDYPWGKDSKRAYSKGDPMSIRDPRSFGSINQNWARDSEAYYATGAGLIKEEGEVIGANFSTFRILRGSYARDRNHIYWGALPIRGADLESFAGINELLAKDKSRTYLCGESR